MQAVMHPDTTLDLATPRDALNRPGDRSVVAVADRIAELARGAQAITAELAELLRDGGNDAVPVESAKDLLVAVRHLTHAGTALSVLALGQLELTGAHLDDAQRSPSSWAEHHCGDTRADLGALRRLQRCVIRYPLIAEAFLAGRLRAGQLCSIDRIIPTHYRGADRERAIEFLGAIQTELLDAADWCRSDRDFARFCAQVQARLDTDGAAPDYRPQRGSELSLTQRRDGRWELRAEFAAEVGALLATMIEDEDRRHLFAQRSAAESTPAAPTSAAPTPLEDRPSLAERHADSLWRLVLAGSGSRRKGRVGVFVHIDVDDLVARGASDPPATCHTESDIDITVESLWSLLADCDVTPIFTRTGTSLSYGRTHRLAPDMLRRVIAHRDRRCGFSECHSPPTWNRAHHTMHWEDGGTTDPWTCKGTCGFHHHCHHDLGWQLDADPWGRPGDDTATRPDGQLHDPTPRWRRVRSDDSWRARTLKRLAHLAANGTDTACRCAFRVGGR